MCLYCVFPDMFHHNNCINCTFSFYNMGIRKRNGNSFYNFFRLSIKI